MRLSYPLHPVKIFLFYTSFYTFLFSFWLFMLLVFLQTIQNDRPNWSHQDSLLKMNPGLSFRPRIPFDNADSSIIIYSLNETDTYRSWVDDLSAFLRPYETNEPGECLGSGLRDEKCPFRPDLGQSENPCQKGESYGYAVGEPCFLVKLNRVRLFVSFSEALNRIAFLADDLHSTQYHLLTNAAAPKTAAEFRVDPRFAIDDVS